MDRNEKELYLQRTIEKYKNNPNDVDLNQAERMLLQQAFTKEANVNKLLEQAKTIQEDIENKRKQLQLLDQQVVFERGQMTGLVDALLSLKSNE